MESSRFNRPRYWILAAAILALTSTPAVVYLVRSAPAVPSIAFSTFLQDVQADSVARVTFGERIVDVLFIPCSTPRCFLFVGECKLLQFFKAPNAS